MKYVTIKDIAKKLNLSISTVSRAFNDKYDIKKETKDRILREAQIMGYKPNLMAKRLVQKRSMNIGIIVPEFINSFFPEVIIGAQKVFFEKGYQVIIMQSNEHFESELENIKSLENNMVDGILLSISNQTQNTDYIKKLVSDGFPIVLFNRVDDTIKVPKVIFDNYKWTFLATQRLLGQGFKKIYYLKGINSKIISLDRVRAFKDAVSKKYIYNSENFKIINAGINFEDGERVAEDLIKKNDLPEAIFAGNDLCAMGAMKTFKKYNFKIPNDIAFFGFTETKFARLTDPPLSSVLQPTFKMGKIAAELLIKKIKNPTLEENPDIIILDGSLNVRESSIKKSK